jgi:hypothetical protein
MLVRLSRFILSAIEQDNRTPQRRLEKSSDLPFVMREMGSLWSLLNSASLTKSLAAGLASAADTHPCAKISALFLISVWLARALAIPNC